MTVEFENSVDVAGFTVERHIPTLPRWLIKSGLSKDESQANIILIALTIILVSISIYTFKTSGSSSINDDLYLPPGPPPSKGII
jgi:hypothetical protein